MNVEAMSNYETVLDANRGKTLLPLSEAPQTGPDENQPIRILLADEPSVFRDGLRALLNGQNDLTVVAEAADAGAVLGLAREHNPNIILLEPEGSGVAIATLRSLQEAKLPTRVILLTATDDNALLSQTIRHGVAGIVHKKSPTEVLLKSIRRVHAGELWLDRATTADVVRQLTRKPIPAPRSVAESDKPAALSKREREIVSLVAQGFRNREIADKLFISEQTVKNHMHNIFEKVGVQDRLELALYAIYHRLYE